MAKNAASHLSTALASAKQSASAGSSLAPVIDINFRNIGRKLRPQTPIGAAAPEGWIKKIDRPREGKVWSAISISTLRLLRQTRTQEEGENVGPATMPKHEAQKKLADYIGKFTGKLIIKETRLHLAGCSPVRIVEEELIAIGIIHHQEPVAPPPFLDRNALGLELFAQRIQCGGRGLGRLLLDVH